jgi:hypothetical protein
MDTFQPSKAGRAAYMQRALKARQREQGSAAFGAGHAVRQAGGVGADLFRHALTVLGVLGLVGIAIGALTDSPTYYTILNWITHWLV